MSSGSCRRTAMAVTGTTEGGRPVDLAYLQQVALAADNLGFYGVLIPTGKSCEDSGWWLPRWHQ